MVQEVKDNHLKLVDGFSFAASIRSWIPIVQQTVRTAVLKELKEWFIVVKESAYKVGKLVMEINTTRAEKVSTIMANEPIKKGGLAVPGKTKDRRKSVMQTLELAINEELEVSIFALTQRTALTYNWISPRYTNASISMEYLGAQLNLSWNLKRTDGCKLIKLSRLHSR